MGLDGRAFDRLCEENHKTLTLAKALELASKWEVRCILKITTSFSRFGNYLHFILDNTNFIDHQIVKNETAKDSELSKVYTAIQSGNFVRTCQKNISTFHHSKFEAERWVWCDNVGITRCNPKQISQKPFAKRSRFALRYCEDQISGTIVFVVAWHRFWCRKNDQKLQCLLVSSARPTKNPFNSMGSTGRVWSRLHIDFAGPVNKNYFLIVTDSHNKWPEVFKTKQSTTNFTINKLLSSGKFSLYFRLPETIVSDNGTQLTSSIFK